MTDVFEQDHRPAVYYDEEIDKWVYRASAVGGCTKKLAALRQEYESHDVPDWLREKMDESSLLEDDAIDVFVSMYAEKIDYIERELPPKTINVPGTNAVIRGKPDFGVVYTDGKREVVEVKNLGTSMFDSNVASLAVPYKGQGTIYVIGWDGIKFFLREKLKKEQIEENPERRPRTHVKTFDGTPMPLIDLINKVKKCEELAETMELPGACDPMQFPCPVYYLHEKETIEPWKDPSAQQEFEELCRAYASAMEQEKAGKAAKKRFQHLLREFRSRHPEYVEGKSLESVHGKVTVSVRGNRQLDEQKIAHFLAENKAHISDFYVDRPYEVMRVTYRS